MSPQMHGDDEIWIIGGHHHANEIAADIAKIARVTTLISIHLRWICDHLKQVDLGPSFPAHFILRMTAESHARLRAPQIFLSPR